MKLLKVSAIVVLIAALGGGASIAAFCPCGPTPGLWVKGETVSEPVADWGFVNEPGLCQLEIRTWKPHALNLNCMSDAGELFVSCSRCEGKTWSSHALRKPEGRILAAGAVYPVMLARVTDEAMLNRAWRARINKLGLDPTTARPDHWWSFRLESR